MAHVLAEDGIFMLQYIRVMCLLWYVYDIVHLVGCNKWIYTQCVQEFNAEEDTEAQGVGSSRQLENITWWKASGWEVLAKHCLGDDIRKNELGRACGAYTDWSKSIGPNFFFF